MRTSKLFKGVNREREILHKKGEDVCKTGKMVGVPAARSTKRSTCQLHNTDLVGF